MDVAVGIGRAHEVAGGVDVGGRAVLVGVCHEAGGTPDALGGNGVLVELGGHALGAPVPILDDEVGAVLVGRVVELELEVAATLDDAGVDGLGVLGIEGVAREGRGGEQASRCR